MFSEMFSETFFFFQMRAIVLTMALLKISIDKRYCHKDGKFAVCIIISHCRRTKYIPLKIFVNMEDWDDSYYLKDSYPGFRYMNANLLDIFTRAKAAMDIHILKRKRFEISLDELYIDVKKTIFPDETSPMNGELLSTFRKFMNTKTGNTLESYGHTLSRLIDYCPNFAKLSFADITRSWLMEFDCWLIEKNNGPNTRGIHFRNLRAVFNFAIDEELTEKYPFRKFKIPKAPTFKRNLKIDSLRLFFNYPVEQWQQEHLDFFKLSFFLIGMNPIDILKCKRSDILDGRLNYRRSKTGKIYSVKLEPEALSIIKKYSGKEYIFAASERYSNNDDFRKRVNKALQKIGPKEKLPGRGGKYEYHPLFPGITLYWARHSWATIASHLDIPKEVISAALGHSSSGVTDVYIEFDSNKIDRANRKVLDYVLYNLS